MSLVCKQHIIPDSSKPVQSEIKDWVWPAADTFPNDDLETVPHSTCSELGSQRIRLIRIRPGPADSPVNCEAKICFLSDAGAYTALSYPWGTPVARHTIFVDNQPCLVTNNLWRFLKQVKKLDSHLSGWLWIDALSIDQSDHHEKLDQINILYSIFEKAANVTIWLGPAFANSDKAMDIVSSYSSGNHRKAYPKLLATQAWSAIHGLCERPYWYRLWVLQELKASKDPHMMCGNMVVRVDDFRQFLFHDHVPRLKDKMRILQKSSAGKLLSLTTATLDTSLWSLLKLTSHLRCSDPHDKAYAVLNVATSGSPNIQPDYTLSMPVLLNSVMQQRHAQVAPKDLEEVAHQCRSLERLFGMTKNSIFSGVSFKVSQYLDRNPGPLTAFCTAEQPEPKLELVLGQWCEHYGHHKVKALLSSTRISKEHEVMRKSRALLEKRSGLASVEAPKSSFDPPFALNRRRRGGIDYNEVRLYQDQR